MARPAGRFADPAANTVIVAAIAAAAGLLAALSGLAFPALSDANPAVPLTLSLAAVSLGLALREGGPSWRARVSRAAAAAVVVLGTLQYFDLGLGALHPPHKSAPVFEAAVTALGLSLWLLDRDPASGRLVQLLASTAAGSALLAILGSLYGVQSPYVIVRGMNAPPAMALSSFLLGAGVLACRPRRGWMLPLTSEGVAGHMARRLLPFAVLVPSLLGALKVAAIARGIPGATLGPLMVISLVGIFVAIIWLGARSGFEQERALRELDEHLQAILDNSTAVVLLKDLEGRYLVVNREMERFHGKPREEILGKTVWDLYPEATAAAMWAAERRVVEERRPIQEEQQFTKPEGKHTHLVVRFPILARDGAVKGIGIIGTDITQRQLLERELKQAQERLQAIADNTSSIIFLKDMAGRFILINKQYEKALGKTRALMLGKTAAEAFPPELAARFEANDQRALREGGPVEIEEQVPAPGGPRTYFTSLFPIFDGSGEPKGVGGVAADITERKRLEKELARAKEELQKLLVERTAKLEETTALLLQAQKMEAVGRLAGGVAHDFNNLLSAVMGFSELLLMSLAPADPRREDAREIQQAARRATDLTRQLLAFSRKQVLQPQTFELNTLIAQVQKMLKRLIGEDIDLSFVPGEGAGKIHADRGQIEQVLMNLAVNARDAMPGGGRLMIETARAVMDEPFAAANPGAKTGPYAAFSVSDTGCGMDRHTLSRLFEPFFTTKEVGKGTGLGLATVYGIVKQSGGYIKVESEVGRGTTFRVYLPEAQGGEEESQAAGEAELPGGSETVLLVEDEEAVRKPIRRGLGLAGYRVLEARDPEEALRLAERHEGPIHLLLTDVVMPKMRGYELARRLGALRPETRVIYMTGYIDQNAPDPESGPRGYVHLQKPIALEVLSRRVREVLDRPPA